MAFQVQHDTLHVHAGLTVFLIGFVATRRLDRRNVYAWLLVLGLELLNKVLDASEWIAWTGHVNWLELAEDLANTILWPSVLLVGMRFRFIGRTCRSDGPRASGAKLEVKNRID